MWREKRDWDIYKHLRYVEYQVSGKAPKDSNRAINHPHVTFWAAHTILPKGKQQGFRGEMKRLTALAWQPFHLAQVSKLLEPAKAGPNPKQGPGPGLPKNSLHWQQHHSLHHSCHGHNPGFEETGVSYSFSRALMTWLKEVLFLEMLSQPQTLKISGPHQMGGIPETLLSYSTEQLHKLCALGPATCKCGLDISFAGEGLDANSRSLRQKNPEAWFRNISVRDVHWTVISVVPSNHAKTS